MQNLRVLVIENELLLGASITSLLAHEPNLNVYGIMPENEQVLCREIYHFTPHVIILGSNSRITSSFRLLAFLQKLSPISVFVINADNKNVQIYTKSESSVTQPQELSSLFQKFTLLQLSQTLNGNKDIHKI
ncbi:MAG: hypothetical protein D6706_12000 [Chloroflexi bacterium]|nr:MAG: hypothetical protein D6706_12000 [Chloroflexota bacterium]